MPWINKSVIFYGEPGQPENGDYLVAILENADNSENPDQKVFRYGYNDDDNRNYGQFISACRQEINHHRQHLNKTRTENDLTDDFPND